MTGKTHQMIGLTVGLGAYLLQAPPHYAPATLGAVLVASHLCALLPDVDQPASTFWRSLPFGRVGGELVNPFLEHRNLTHSLLGTALVAALLWWMYGLFPSYWGIDWLPLFIASLSAYLSHLVADMLTVEGIPLFFPWGRMFGLPPWPLSGLRIETGKWFENLIVFPLVNLALLFLIWKDWPQIHQLLFH